MDSPTSDQESEMEVELRLALEEASLEAGFALSAALYPSALFWLGDSDAVPAYKLRKWLACARRETKRKQSLLSGLRRKLSKLPLESLQTESVVDVESTLSPRSRLDKDPQELSLNDKLSKVVELDINSAEFTWEALTSLHHREHAASSKSTEDDMSKTLEVTVNSGGVVYFAMFNKNGVSHCGESQTAAAVLKCTPSRLATQSECFGHELAKHMGVCCPQSRVIHKGASEWKQLKKAAEGCLGAAKRDGDTSQEATCIEFLEAMNLSQCFLLMGYIQGCAFLDSQHAFKTPDAAKRTAAALGRILLLDLVLHNEDRLFNSELGWRGNAANLLCTEVRPLGHQTLQATQVYMHSLPTSECARPSENKKEFSFHKERNFKSMKSSDMLPINDSPMWRIAMQDKQVHDIKNIGKGSDDFYLVTIDSGVPRRPPAGKRASDRQQYPKVVELILNSTHYAASMLYDVSGKNLGNLLSEETSGNGVTGSAGNDRSQVIKAFQSGFREGIKDMQDLHVFLLKLYRMLEIALRKFFLAITKACPAEEGKPIVHNVDSRHSKKSASGEGDSPATRFQSVDCQWDSLHCQQEGSDHFLKGRETGNTFAELSRGDTPLEASSQAVVTIGERLSEKPLENCEHSQLSTRLTLKLKDVNKNAKFDVKLNEELKHWNEVLYSEGRILCQEKGFVTGFLEGGGSHSVVDSYELKIRLEHVLERMDSILQGADTEKPSQVLDNLYIGGVLAAKSLHTLQDIGVTHIICLCPSQVDSFGEDFTHAFHYRKFQVHDLETTEISCIFEEACDFIDSCGNIGGKALIHCFEGRSRSATIVLAYLMLRKNMTLLQAWRLLKSVHQRAQPNDGFMHALVELDKKLHGTTSMDCRRKKPSIQICPICEKTAGFSISSLTTHMQKSHHGINNAGK